MEKIKKAFLTVIVFLFTVVMCMPLIACGTEASGGQGNEADLNEGIEPLGLYTDLEFVLNGENGYVQASVKNKFTLFPSTVTVNLELYRWDSYTENVDEMVMVSSSYIHDLDQGETIIAAASTGGKQSYWKARASYRVDNKPWQENFSETVLFDANARKTTVSAPVPDDRDYYVADFFQSDAKSVGIHCFPERIPHYEPDQRHNNLSLTVPDDYFWLENEEQINSVREVFGEIKLEPFDMDNKSYYEKQQFYFSYNNTTYFNVKLNDGSSANISINDRKKDVLGANLFVSYYKDSTSGNFNKCFTATIPEEAKQAILDAIDNIYKIQHNINAYATEWINFSDLLQGEVLSGNTDLRVRFPFYGESEERIKFSVDGSDLESVNNNFSEVKVTPYDMNKEMPAISAEYYFNTSVKYNYYSLSVKFADGRAVDAYISYMYTSNISVNLFIVYNDGGTFQYYSGLLDVETQEALVELTKNLYDQKIFIS